MKFAFALNLSQELNKFVYVFNQIEWDINKITQNANYGEDVTELYIGIICVLPQFEVFFKPRKPRYDRDEKVYEKEGVKYKLHKTLQYEIRLNYEIFKDASEIEAKKILLQEIFQSLKALDKMKGKLKDFNTTKFKEDLERYFMEKKLM